MLKEAHAILGYYPAAEGLDLEVQKLGDGGYRSLNVVIVNASAKLAEGFILKCPRGFAWPGRLPGKRWGKLGEQRGRSPRAGPSFAVSFHSLCSLTESMSAGAHGMGPGAGPKT